MIYLLSPLRDGWVSIILLIVFRVPRPITVPFLATQLPIFATSQPLYRCASFILHRSSSSLFSARYLTSFTLEDQVQNLSRRCDTYTICSRTDDLVRLSLTILFIFGVWAPRQHETCNSYCLYPIRIWLTRSCLKVNMKCWINSANVKSRKHTTKNAMLNTALSTWNSMGINFLEQFEFNISFGESWVCHDLFHNMRILGIIKVRVVPSKFHSQLKSHARYQAGICWSRWEKRTLNVNLSTMSERHQISRFGTP
jgi:hypothetical protein